jgi:hypothetical protein
VDDSPETGTTLGCVRHRCRKAEAATFGEFTGGARRSGAGSGGTGREGAVDQERELVRGVPGPGVSESRDFVFEQLVDGVAVLSRHRVRGMGDVSQREVGTEVSAAAEARTRVTLSSSSNTASSRWRLSTSTSSAQAHLP